MEFNFNMRTLVQGAIVGFIIAMFLLVFYFFYPRVWGSLIYPLKYPDLIEKYSTEYNLDKNFVAALIYSESGFRKDSVSPVGARGLMQIMPATAEGIALRIGDANFSAGKLFEPEINIRYGCFYVREKLDMYNDDLTLILIAYNAGGGSADRYQENPDRNILPYETQGFTRRVKYVYGRYQQIYGNDWANIDRGEGLAGQVWYWLTGK